MAHDASQLLGAQQVAGALVNRRGHGWQHAARATGGLAGVAMGYAAGEVLARVPRSEVASAVVSRGALRTNLTIAFTNGGSWAFEVSPLVGRTVARVADALRY